MKRLLMRFLEGSSSSLLRRAITVRSARRDEVGTRQSASERNTKLLSPTDLAVPRAPRFSRELFILGTGPSVLNLTKKNIERMKMATTIGLNSWVLHDFIPNAYSFEEMPDDSYITVATGLSTALARQEVIIARPKIFHLRPKLNTPSRRLIDIPAELQSRTVYYGRCTPVTKRIENLEKDLATLLKAQRNGRIASTVMIDGGMSVSRMISLGIQRGFDTIVLVGVDLNSSSHYFELDSSFQTRHGLGDFLPPRGASDSHGTEDTFNRNFPASRFLVALARASEKSNLAKIYVGSDESKLARDLDLFPW